MASNRKKSYYQSDKKLHSYRSHLVAYARSRRAAEKKLVSSKNFVFTDTAIHFNSGNLRVTEKFTMIRKALQKTLHEKFSTAKKFTHSFFSEVLEEQPSYSSYRSSENQRQKRNSKQRKAEKLDLKLPSFTTNLAELATLWKRFYKKTKNILRRIYQLINHFLNYLIRAVHYSLKRLRAGLKKSGQVIKRATSSFFKISFIRILFSPLQPFYYSFKLFPIHSAVAILLSLGIFGATYEVHELIFKDLPSVAELTSREPIVSSKILDRNGKLLYQLYKDENRTIVPLSAISPDLINATIAIEDKEFYSHHGFSVRGIIRAALTNFQGEISQGGSTITQQLVKQRLLSSERTWTRKIKEVILAILVEGTYSKQEILSMYLNQVPYGGSTYGIEEAAQRYFGKSARDLTLAESSLLAGLPAAPTIYSPFGPNRELAEARQDEVLRRMVEDSYITQAQADGAALETLSFRSDQVDIIAPHFVMYVRDMMARQYGEESLLTEGLEIRTSLDLDLQNKTQEIVTKEVDQLRRLHITNGAALVTNPHTGEVLAMVGSTNYFDFTHDGQVNITTRQRQPGSSIKPITYAMALEKGSTVTSLIKDEPITYRISGSDSYSPKNYDGKFHGMVPLKEALASSYNIPAVKMLDSVGVSAMITKAESMGITTWQDRKRFGLSLTLGSGETRMVDMATVYSSFANKGVSMPLNPILEVKNYKGEVLYHNDCALEDTSCNGRRVLDPRIAFLISNILSDNQARTPAFGPLSELYIPGQEVAVKTGTTNTMRDNWAFGYTSNRLTAVWVGNNDNTPMSYVASGVTGASPIWNRIMRLSLDDKNPHKFPVPDGLVKVATCFRTGTLACGGCGRVSEEYYVVGTEPKNNCNIAKKSPEKTQEAKAEDSKRKAPVAGAEERR